MPEDKPTIKKLEKLLTDSVTEIKQDILNAKEETNSNVFNIQNDLTELKDHIIQSLVDENKKLQAKVASLESKLFDCEVSLECNNQYIRRNNIEISGISNNIDNKNLQTTVINTLNSININATDSDIEACHRLPASRNNPNQKVIVRFTNR